MLIELYQREVVVKQLIVTLLFVFVYVCLFASWVPFRAGDNQLHLNVTKSDNAGVSFTIAINGMDSEEVVHNGVTYQRIEILENSGFGAVGSPAIPRIIKLVAIPECQDVTLSVSVNTPTVLSNYNLYPNPQLVINTDANGAKYSSEVFYINNGIYSYNSYADITNSNFFNRNNICIKSLNGSSIKIVGNANLNMVNEGQRFMSSVRAIEANHSSFPYEVTWNYFSLYQNNEWMNCTDHEINTSHNVTNNGWDTANFIPGRNLDVSVFEYLPVWDQNLPAPPPFNAKELFYMAEESYKQGNLTGAEQLYKAVIASYPDTEYAVASAKALLPLSQAIYENLTLLKNYYDNNDVMNTHDELIEVANKYSVLCDVIDMNYPEAIQEYENILSNFPSYTDSIYAIIDLGYTYLLMEENSPKLNYTGRYPQFKPTSYVEFTTEREALLSSLMSSPENQSNDANITSPVIQSVFPNPFRNSISFSFTLPTRDFAEVYVYNIKGQLVKKIRSQMLNKGLNSIDWDGKNERGARVASGIYVYKLSSCGKEITGKAVMIK